MQHAKFFRAVFLLFPASVMAFAGLGARQPGPVALRMHPHARACLAARPPAPAARAPVAGTVPGGLDCGPRGVASASAFLGLVRVAGACGAAARRRHGPRAWGLWPYGCFLCYYIDVVGLGLPAGSAARTFRVVGVSGAGECKPMRGETIIL